MTACDVINRLAGCVSSLHHEVGLISIATTTPTTVGMNLGGAWGTLSSLNNGSTYGTAAIQSILGGAMEAGAIAQTNSMVSVGAHTAIDTGSTSGKIYLATSSNWTSTVEPNLSGYDSGTISNIQNSVNNSDYVLLPDNGNLTFPNTSLTGLGYLDFTNPSNGNGCSCVILGYWKGGLGGQPTTPPTVNDQTRKNGIDPNTTQLPGDSGGDPIDLFSGAFYYTHDDISVGSSAAPYKLTFTRRYDSRDALVNNGLGFGWSHSFQIAATNSTDISKGMGSDNAVDMAPTIAASYVMFDLIGMLATPVVDKYTVAALVNKWQADQQFLNTVSVSKADGARVFCGLPDGSFSTPSKLSGALSESGGNYSYRDSNGATYNFNSSGVISTIVYPFGVTLTFTYTSGLLTSVTNGLGRTLTINYTGTQITSVTDGNGRSVHYGYDGNNNLTSFSDTLSHQTTYAYDQPGRMTQIFCRKIRQRPW